MNKDNNNKDNNNKDNNNNNNNNKKYKGEYRHVIGGHPNLRVKIGTNQEKYYFSVMPCKLLSDGCSEDDIQNVEKKFYISPRHYPEYEEMMKSETGKNIIKKWERKQSELYDKKTKNDLQKNYIHVN
jgi:hypothetical protein